MQILLAEDSPIMRRIIGTVVTNLGFQAVKTANGAECLATLRKISQKTALVILDWNMPIMNGYQALKTIRAHEEYDHIPVLMATADGVEGDVLKALQAGANAYLVKPFKEEELSERITELLNEFPVAH